MEKKNGACGSHSGIARTVHTATAAVTAAVTVAVTAVATAAANGGPNLGPGSLVGLTFAA